MELLFNQLKQNSKIKNDPEKLKKLEEMKKIFKSDLFKGNNEILKKIQKNPIKKKKKEEEPKETDENKIKRNIILRNVYHKKCIDQWKLVY